MDIRIVEDKKENVGWQDGKTDPFEPNVEVRKLSFEVWDGDTQVVRSQALRFKTGTAKQMRDAISARAEELQSGTDALTSLALYTPPPEPAVADFELVEAGAPYMATATPPEGSPKDPDKQAAFQRYKVFRKGVSTSVLIVEGADTDAFLADQAAKYDAAKAAILSAEADRASAAAIVG